MMNEKISVIVPVYNVEKYLPRCVESLVNQTYPNMEIILVDDGSPDTCPAWCDKSHHDNPLKIKVIHKENGGVMSARCAGIEAATGEYIGFVDGDDYVEPDMYEFLHELIVTTGADAAQCGQDSVDGDKVTTFATGEKRLDTGAIAVKLLLNNVGDYTKLYTKLYRKKLFDGQKLDYGFKIVEDNLANYFLLRRSATVAYWDQPKYHYVDRPGSAMRRPYPAYWIENSGKFFEIVLAEEGPESELIPDIKAAVIKYCAEHSMYILYTGRNEQYLEPLTGYIKKKKQFVRENPGLFGKTDKIKIALLMTNKKLAKFVYTKIREGRK